MVGGSTATVSVAVQAPAASTSAVSRADDDYLDHGPRTATLAGANSPTGKITFRAYGPDDADCSDPPAWGRSVTVSGNGDYASPTFAPPQAGTYRFIAAYSGDAQNPKATGSCDDAGESVTAIDPIAVDDAYTIDVDSGPRRFDVRANDQNPGGRPFSVSSFDQPANGTVARDGGALAYTPDPGYCNSPPGDAPDTFTYTLVGGSTATVSVAVRCGG